MPTIHRERGYRFFFWSNERNEPPHVHVESGENYAKVWLVPEVRLARSVGFDTGEVRDLLAMVVQYRERFEAEWHGYFRT